MNNHLNCILRRIGFVKRLATPLLAAVVLAACGGGNGGGIGSAQTDKDRIAALEADGKLPKLDRSADLKGPDLNSDGVRDDIEAILKAKYQGKQLAATVQFARSYRPVFDLPEGDRVAAQTVSNQGTRAMKCLHRKFDGETLETNPSVVSRQIVAMTFNTKERLKTYMRYNATLSGSVLSLPDGDTCEE